MRAASQAICSSLNRPISSSFRRGPRYSLAPLQAHTFTAAVVGVDELNSGKLQGALNRVAFDFSQHAGENGVGNAAVAPKATLARAPRIYRADG